MKIHFLNLSRTQGQSQIIVHPALIDDGEERILFDTGYSEKENPLVLELQRLGNMLRYLSGVESCPLDWTVEGGAYLF